MKSDTRLTDLGAHVMRLAIDLIREDELREDRAGVEIEGPQIAAEHGDTEDVGYDMVPPKNLATLAFLVEFGVQGPLGMEEGTEIVRAATKAILEEMYSTGADSEAILNKKNKEGDGIYTISDEAMIESGA